MTTTDTNAQTALLSPAAHKLTALQATLLLSALGADHRDGRHPVGCEVWTSTVTDAFENRRQAGGAFAAAQKAGLISCSAANGDDDSSLSLTQKGWEAICARYGAEAVGEEADYNFEIEVIFAAAEGQERPVKSEAPYSPALNVLTAALEEAAEQLSSPPAEVVVTDEPAVDASPDALQDVPPPSTEQIEESPAAGPAPLAPDFLTRLATLVEEAVKAADPGRWDFTKEEIKAIRSTVYSAVERALPAAPSAAPAERAPSAGNDAVNASKAELRKHRPAIEAAVLSVLADPTVAKPVTVPFLLDAASKLCDELGKAHRRAAHYEVWAACCRLKAAKKVQIENPGDGSVIQLTA